MTIIKRGEALPILTIENPLSHDDDEKAKLALEAAKQRAKNIQEDGNKTGFTVESNS